MRIVNRKQFLELPSGVLYSKYEPCYFDGLYVKLGTIRGMNNEPVDFRYKDIIANLDVNDSIEFVEVLVKAEETGEHIKLDFDCVDRDGLYDNEQLYAVYSQEEIANLSKVIAGCVGV